LPRAGKKVIHFYNYSGNLEKAVKFLENIQKKVNYINLNATVNGRSIKITLYGSKDLQHLACERLRDLAEIYLC
jgi:hypothetical protein